MVEDFNRSHLTLHIPIGAQVMTRTTVMQGKTDQRFEGPYTVVRRTRSGAYELLDHDGQLLHRKFAPSQVKLVSLADAEGTSYEVKAILNHRKDADGHSYKVRWKGYDASYDLWVKESDFDDTQVIRDYWAHLKHQSRSVNRKEEKGKY